MLYKQKAEWEKLQVNGYSFPGTFSALVNQVPPFAVERLISTLRFSHPVVESQELPPTASDTTLHIQIRFRILTTSGKMDRKH